MALKIDIDNSSIIELRKELKRLKDELSAATDPQQIQGLAEAAGQVSDKMKDVNEQVALFAAGSPFERAGIQLNEVKSALVNLDFEKAASRAKALSTTIQGISFKSATAGLKQMGSTFIQLGKSLLTNPLFLLAAVIVAIGVAIFELLKKTGILNAAMKALGKVFDVLMIPINALIQGLKDLADWFGITNNAAKDGAESTAKWSKATAEAQESATADVIVDLDREIAVRKARGEDTVKLERQKLVELQKLAMVQAMAANDELISLKLKKEAGEDIDEEEIAAAKKKTEDLYREYRKRVGDIDVFNAQVEAKDKDRIDAEKKKEDDDAKRRADAARKAAEERKKAEEAAAREIETLRISLIKDQYEREEAQIRENLKRQLEDLAKNEKISAEKRAQLRALYQQQADAELANLEEQKRQEALAKEKAFQEALAKLVEVPVKSAIELLNEQQEAERLQLEERFKNHENYQQLLDALDEKYRKKREEAQAAEVEKEKALLEQQAVDRLYIAANSDGATMEQRLAFLEAERLQELSQKDLTERQIFDINKKYADATKALDEEQKASKMALVMATLDAFKANFDAIASLSDAILSNEEANLEEGSKEAEAAAKKRFEINKAFQIGQALINTAVAVTSALANPPGPPFSIPQAIAAGISGAAQVAAIAATKYKGGAGKVASVGGGPATTSSAPAASPSFNLFGSNNNQNNVPATSNINGPGQVPSVVKAIVVESDITGVQKKINRIETLSEL